MTEAPSRWEKFTEWPQGPVRVICGALIIYVVALVAWDFGHLAKRFFIDVVYERWLKTPW